MAGQCKARLEALEGGRLEGSRKTAQEAASFGFFRERLHEKASRAQGSRMELRLRDGPKRRWPHAEDDAHRGRSYTRECLALEVERSITAKEVVRTLANLFEQRGEPAFVRSDNGPEFIAEAVKRWLEVSGVKTLYIEPGSPWENAYSETFISRFSDELLEREVLANLLEAKVLVEEYRRHYNHERPHSALGYRTPAEFALSCELESVDKELTREIESATTLS